MRIANRYGLSISTAAVLLSGCGGLQPPTGAPRAIFQHAALETRTFRYTGHEQTFTVPSGVTEINVVGEGASGSAPSGFALGGLVKATISVNPERGSPSMWVARATVADPADSTVVARAVFTAVARGLVVAATVALPANLTLRVKAEGKAGVASSALVAPAATVKLKFTAFPAAAAVAGSGRSIPVEWPAVAVAVADLRSSKRAQRVSRIFGGRRLLETARSSFLGSQMYSK